ncbi:histidine phosphatase family protein [Rufibacter glacialis]|uniref:Histidine phosphatase family protein n=1 Tax=Rufibacter glacialis TaxID=1259555 RepID=A0A5M8Q310_9BACT|nr:histidine phosphatase family protein [Rufibacter glacialis]KAA6430219.1 histidine phosphatase family protein [Rufibacter glacialis]GGK87457.1 phosphoglycerate mutase [Rufibacter glacialis]
MKTLYLLRHAKSSWKYEELSDHDRPLNKRGRTDAPLIGQELVEREVKLDLIISSSAVRAITTATLVAKELGIDPEQIGVQEELYLIATEDLRMFAQSLPDEYHQVMLVGHNPALTELANHFSPEKNIANIPTAGVVALSFDCHYWAEISGDNAKLLFFDFPKNYR